MSLFNKNSMGQAEIRGSPDVRRRDQPLAGALCGPAHRAGRISSGQGKKAAGAGKIAGGHEVKNDRYRVDAAVWGVRRDAGEKRTLAAMIARLDAGSEFVSFSRGGWRGIQGKLRK